MLRYSTIQELKLTEKHRETNRTKKKDKKKKVKITLITYFDYTAAPDGSCGVPSHAEPPFDVLPASSAPLHWDDSDTVATHRIPACWKPSGNGTDRIR